MLAISEADADAVFAEADLILAVVLSREACPLNLAPTASTTALLAVGDALAMALSEKRGFKEEDFAALHPGGELGKRFLKVRDLMRTGERVPRVSRETPMTETIHEMSRKLMGVTGVVNGKGDLVGVISDGDIRRLVEKDPRLLSRTAGDCLHLSPRTIPADALATEALARMEDWKITSLFITDENGRLSGALHMHDLLSAGIR